MQNSEKVMNVEEIREYCLSLPLATEDFPFDESILAFRVLGKVFAMIDLDDTKWFVLKCDADYAVALREENAEIKPAWHMNKRYWNQIDIYGGLSDCFIRSIIDHSYSEVVKKMPRKNCIEHPEIALVGRMEK